ncbi:hypothetical protein DFH08DRAFT_1084832 [Mycena albidolilacea]|uniref:Uncharacterized protein n=1 Tax=Mycena albidolilacea TaxID=1033008 RepID=A0AAD7EIC0_9AGAR|nr:hypothetical protein DFH08DRAFT_1084832 [Mycena albidolilacea]
MYIFFAVVKNGNTTLRHILRSRAVRTNPGQGLQWLISIIPFPSKKVYVSCYRYPEASPESTARYKSGSLDSSSVPTMKEHLASQVLSLLSLILIPFIPDSTLRYIAVVLASVSLVAYLVYHNTPTCQVDRLDAAAKEVNALFEAATAECVADPQFVYEAGLKLTELNYAVSTLRSRTLSTRSMSWKGYAYRLRVIASSIEQCRRELEELRSSILLALECARQQRYQEDIHRRTATLDSAFPGATPFTNQGPDERPAVFERMSFRTGSVPYEWDLDQ